MQSFLSLIFLASVIAIIYFWKKSKAIQQENPEDFESNEEHQKLKNNIKIAAAVCIISILFSNFVSSDEEEIKSAVTEVQMKALENTKSSTKNRDLKLDITFDKINIDDDYATVTATTTLYGDGNPEDAKFIYRFRKIDGKWKLLDIRK